MFIDDRATDEQAEAMQAVYSGAKGGPIVDLIQLVGEVTSVERVPIVLEVVGGKGTLKLSVFKQMGQMFGLAKGVFCASFSCYAACR